MSRCPHCFASVVDSDLRCGQCGTEVESYLSPTLLKESDRTEILDDLNHAPGHSFLGHSGSSSPHGGQFSPGSVLSGRYRIVALLGRGGMGEVYRADDLKLNQPVALKFLPSKLAIDGPTLARFHREVRIARQVSHPNVCRVFDIGEAEGRPFLTMEYIDGEDLSVLLRRIGRLPQDKAVDIARHLCSGLAAAHDVGVLHRDLKPANVMIDGRGRARITDFGLAVIFDEESTAENLAGTPAYMAPEQLAGEEVTARTDIYSLGLVLYELFTGKRVFDSNSLAEQALRHESEPPKSPSSFVKGLDPLIERSIMRCLERDPNARPASAVQVAAALPGGDPLQAALLAGELPSPEMVAAAGNKTGMKPKTAVAMVVSAVGLILVNVLLGSQVNLLEAVRLERSPEVLAQRGRDVIAQLGYPERPVDSAFGMYVDSRQWEQINKNDRTSERWARLAEQRPGIVRFWYRESPDYFLTFRRPPALGDVRWNDPPRETPGMTGVALDAAGNLHSFYAVPPLTDESQPPENEPTWDILFTAAGLDSSRFERVDPLWVPRNAYDFHAAWTGTFTDQAEPAIRVEAASRRGKFVSFEIIEPWIQPDRPTAGVDSYYVFITSLFVIVIFGAALLAASNLRHGRADRSGALRLSLFLGALWMIQWTLWSDHAPDVGEGSLLADGVAEALYYSAFTWLLYVALEPFARRRWPMALVSWNRLLDGSFRDPLIGRDILIGVLAGLVIRAVFVIAAAISMETGGTPLLAISNLRALFGVRIFGGWLAGAAAYSIVIALVTLFLFVFLRGILRHQYLAISAFIVLMLIPSFLLDTEVSRIVPEVANAAILAYIALRHGLLALVLATFAFMLFNIPITRNPSNWYFGASVTVVLLQLTLAGFGFRTSLGGQTVFKDGVFGG